MTLYVVAANGHNSPYGSEIYLVGVFDDRKKATKIANRLKCPTEITEVELNKKYSMTYSKLWDEWINGNYLGGYSE